MTHHFVIVNSNDVEKNVVFFGDSRSYPFKTLISNLGVSNIRPMGLLKVVGYSTSSFLILALVLSSYLNL